MKDKFNSDSDLKQRISAIAKKNRKTVNSPDKVDLNPKKRPMKKILKFISDTVAGDNKAGEAIHGILDLLPIPNQPIAKAVSYLKSGDSDKANKELSKLLSFRNIVALLLFILLVTGVITIEDVRKIITLFSTI